MEGRVPDRSYSAEPMLVEMLFEDHVARKVCRRMSLEDMIVLRGVGMSVAGWAMWVSEGRVLDRRCGPEPMIMEVCFEGHVAREVFQPPAVV